jgi:hypothetical protein
VYILIIKIRPSQQSFSEYHTFKARGENCFRTPELADNTFIIYGNISIQKLIAEKTFRIEL